MTISKTVAITFPAEKTVFAFFGAGSPVQSTVWTVLLFRTYNFVSKFHIQKLICAKTQIYCT
jgi:hypothetical protein